MASLAQVADRLVTHPKRLSDVAHGFYYCIDGHNALLMWISRGIFHQRLIKTKDCRQTVRDLKLLGYRCEELDCGKNQVSVARG